MDPAESYPKETVLKPGGAMVAHDWVPQTYFQAKAALKSKIPAGKIPIHSGEEAGQVVT